MTDGKKQSLGLFSLTSIAIGMVIGSGVVALIGPAIGYTGKSAGLAYAAAVIGGLVLIIPVIFISSTLMLEGGEYMIIRTLLGKTASGIFIWNYMVTHLALSVSALAMGTYAQSLFPACNITAVAFITITIFYIVNLMGIKFMSKVENILVFFLILGLVGLIVAGLLNLNDTAWQVTSDGYFMGGLSGFLSAAVLLVFSTTCHQLIVGLTPKIREPKKNLPRALVLTSGIIVLLYGFAGFIAANVLPVSEVAGKPLTVIAREILPAPLFVFFIIAVPLFAICTTLNGFFSAAPMPMLRGGQDGWFPKCISKTNKHGVPWVITTILYGITALPVLLKFSIAVVTNNTLLILYLLKFMVLAAAFFLPTKCPEQWKQSRLHIPNWLYYIILSICALAQITVIVISGSGISAALLIISIGILVVLSGFSFYMGKKVIITNPIPKSKLAREPLA